MKESFSVILLAIHRQDIDPVPTKNAFGRGHKNTMVNIDLFISEKRGKSLGMHQKRRPFSSPFQVLHWSVRASQIGRANFLLATFFQIGFVFAVTNRSAILSAMSLLAKSMI